MEEKKNNDTTEEAQNTPEAPAEEAKEKEAAPAPEKPPVSKGIAAAFGIMGTAIVGLTAALIITNLPDSAPAVQENTVVTTTTAETTVSASETETTTQEAVTNQTTDNTVTATETQEAVTTVSDTQTTTATQTSVADTTVATTTTATMITIMSVLFELPLASPTPTFTSSSFSVSFSSRPRVAQRIFDADRRLAQNERPRGQTLGRLHLARGRLRVSRKNARALRRKGCRIGFNQSAQSLSRVA